MVHDYKQLGFKCGIEIHQQLEGKKLFCDCPTEIRKDKPDFEVIRRLRASAGESGGIDAAASHEERKAKHFIYQGYEDSTCLVELDEEPPHEMNKDALKTVLEVARMLNCKIIDEIQVMRKTVIDGSNTSGFQRTALVGVDGYVEIDGKRIGVPTVCLEEEACQVIQRTDGYDIYNLSRLGIPLIEIGTDPDITTPEEAEKTAGKLGMILRSTGKVKRGIGTIRQDVNLSIKGGNRIEVKGFQDLKSIPKVIDNEISRHLKLLKEGKPVDAQVRKAEPDFTTSFLRPMPGADRMYPETDIVRELPDFSDLQEHKLLDEKVADWQKDYGISEDLAKQLAKRGDEFEPMMKKYPKVEPKLIANIITSLIVELRRKTGKDISADELGPVFTELNDGKLSAERAASVITDYAETGKFDFSKYESVSDDELRAVLKKVMEQNKGAPMSALMGKAMAALKGKADGKKVSELLKELA